MAKKQNPLLEAFEAKLQANYMKKLEINCEFDYIAFLKTVNEELQVGPGRAPRVFRAFLANKMELAEAIDKDYGDKDSGDKQILHTKATYAKLIRSYFRPEDWQEFKEMFQFLRDYWEG
jgi:hypothetical protein